MQTQKEIKARYVDTFFDLIAEMQSELEEGYSDFKFIAGQIAILREILDLPKEEAIEIKEEVIAQFNQMHGTAITVKQFNDFWIEQIV